VRERKREQINRLFVFAMLSSASGNDGTAHHRQHSLKIQFKYNSAVAARRRAAHVDKTRKEKRKEKKIFVVKIERYPVVECTI